MYQVKKDEMVTISYITRNIPGNDYFDYHVFSIKINLEMSISGNRAALALTRSDETVNVVICNVTHAN